MRSSIAIPLMGLSILLAGVSCDDPVTGPRGTIVDPMAIAGSYEGTVQKPGISLAQAGSAELVVNQTEDGIAGRMRLDAEFGEGTETISLHVNATYTGEVVRQATAHTIRLRLANPDCGGITEFTGTYSAEHLTLSGQYILKEADGCRTVATLDLTVSLDRSPE